MNTLTVEKIKLGYRFIECDKDGVVVADKSFYDNDMEVSCDLGYLYYLPVGKTKIFYLFDECESYNGDEFVTFLVLEEEPTDDNYDDLILDICVKKDMLI